MNTLIIEKKLKPVNGFKHEKKKKKIPSDSNQSL
jgi:hypothetical protein